MNSAVAAPYEWRTYDPVWIPPLDASLEPDHEQLKAEFDVERQAHDDGFRDRPHSTEREMNETQLRIHDFAVENIGKLFASLSHRLAIAAHHMVGEAAPLDLRNKELEAETVF